MTIGMAVRAPAAGAALLTALSRLEAISDGAIGGFVSVAAMTADGTIARAEVQRGGARALLDSLQDRAVLECPLAVVMSSGPDRPAPLAQFTPARARVGLVTGHRFPNTLGSNGKPIAEEALDLIENGLSPDAAVSQVVTTNPRSDAGLILLSANGRIGIADSPLLRRHHDRGMALEQTDSYSVAVLHNSIEPTQLLAPLALYLVKNALGVTHGVLPVLRLAAGVPVHHSSDRSCIVVDGSGEATALEIATECHGDDPWSAGLGPKAAIMRADRLIGHTNVDPFLVIRGGRLVSVNGLEALSLPYVEA